MEKNIEDIGVKLQKEVDLGKKMLSKVKKVITLEIVVSNDELDEMIAYFREHKKYALCEGLEKFKK